MYIDFVTITLPHTIMTTYIIQDREAGNVIDSFNTIEEAEKALIEYEEQDKKDGIYEENFYEITQK